MKSIGLDLWHIISIGDLKPTKIDFENQYNNPKTNIDKNTKAKLLIFIGQKETLDVTRRSRAFQNILLHTKT